MFESFFTLTPTKLSKGYLADNIDEMLRGYYLERKVINEYEQAELISSRYAKQLRKEVNTLEDYSLKETSNTLTYDMINLARGRA